jgi:Protein of unknown function (DUF2958)
MKLLTKELLRSIPPLYGSENETDPWVVCKFFTPDSSWTWYVIEGSTRERLGCGWGENCNHRPLREYNPETDDVLFYGYVVGVEIENGYFSLSEIQSVRGDLGLPVERDRWFTPCRVSELPVW